MKLTKIYLLAFACILFFSCGQDRDFADNNDEIRIDEHFVEQRVAIAVAEMIEFPVRDSISTRSALTTEYREVASAVPIGDPSKPSYYVINYKDNKGFLIFSADNRIDPVLAYANEGQFNVDYADMPDGLFVWMEGADDMVKNVRIEGGDPTRLANTTRSGYILDPDHPNYDPCAIQHIIGANPGLCGVYDPCAQKYASAGPLLKTKWGQLQGFNNNLGLNYCEKIPGYNAYGNPPTGCVITATAQVMRYHRYAGNRFYDWDKMDDRTGGYETSQLMADLGRFLGADYSCELTGAKTENIPQVLKDHYMYASASYGDINHNTIMENLDAGRPVILRGGRQSNGLLPIYKDGHAWVCEGYTRIYSDCSGGGSAVNYYMNWVWTNGVYNGWFSCNDWTLSNGDSFNYKTKMVYNIKPR